MRHGNRASVRHEVRIGRSADDIWVVVGEPARICQWFPGIEASPVEGEIRTITTGAGLTMPELLLTVDPLQRRLQYRITTSLVREHLGTIDVHDLGDGTSLVVYSTDAEPATLALVIGGAAANALRTLRTQLERAPTTEPGGPPVPTDPFASTESAGPASTDRQER